MKYAIITIFLGLISCGTIDTVNIGDGADPKASEDGDSDEKIRDDIEPAPQESPTVEVETTTTTTTKVVVGGDGSVDSTIDNSDGKPTLVAKYQLVNDNPAVDEFVGQNYCVGNVMRDCWIRSGLLWEYSDGTYEVSIEFWDTERMVPYNIESKKMVDGEEKALLLTDYAKTIDDDTVMLRKLWAVVVPGEKLVGVYYDWAGDGPQEQGDDLLDAFEFELVGDAGAGEF